MRFPTIPAATSALALLASCSANSAEYDPAYKCKAPDGLNQAVYDKAFRGAVNPNTGLTADLLAPIAYISKEKSSSASTQSYGPPDSEARRKRNIESILNSERPYVRYLLNGGTPYRNGRLVPLDNGHLGSGLNVFSFLRFGTMDNADAERKIYIGRVTEMPFVRAKYTTIGTQIENVFEGVGDRVEVFGYGQSCRVVHVYTGDIVTHLAIAKNFHNWLGDSSIGDERSEGRRCEQQFALNVRGLMFLEEDDYAADRVQGTGHARASVGFLSTEWKDVANHFHHTLSSNGPMNQAELCAASQSLDWYKFTADKIREASCARQKDGQKHESCKGIETK